MSHRYIALDIGDVCLKINIPATLQRLNLTEIPLQLLPAIDLYERGKISEVTLLDAFTSTLPNFQGDVDTLKSAWNAMIGDMIPGMDAFVNTAITLGYRFIFFSDTNPAHFLKCIQKIPFAHLIDGRIVSYEVGAKKPEDAMFESFERLYGSPAFYIDDKPQNIEVARKKHGWSGVVFENAEQATQAIKAYHLAHTHNPEEIDDYNL